jgi:hypothetical protein
MPKTTPHSQRMKPKMVEAAIPKKVQIPAVYRSRRCSRDARLFFARLFFMRETTVDPLLHRRPVLALSLH